MSIKRNIIANLIAQGYVSLVGIAVLPLYVEHIGLEAYGLVGVFTLLQAWMNVLDMGLTPTVARESARFNGGGIDALTYRRLMRALQAVYGLLGICAAILLLIGSEWIATRWLKPASLPISEVEASLRLVALGVAMRWVSGFYRSCISGYERLAWLGTFNCAIATLRFVGVLPLVIWVTPEPVPFFVYQLVVAGIELLVLFVKAHALFPRVAPALRIGWLPSELIRALKPVLKLSMAFSFTSIAWIFVMQLDKVALSTKLTLSDYGAFSLAVLVASGVLAIASPIGGALLPRLAKLQAEGKGGELVALYRSCTQLVAAIAVPLALIGAFHAHDILQLWSGSGRGLDLASTVLRLYVLGNMLLVLGAFPYYLQFAHGELRLHVLGNGLLVSIYVPAVLLGASWAGAIGAGYAWLVCHALYLVLWAPTVHRKFLQGTHRSWLLGDICSPVWPSLLLIVATAAVPWPTQKGAQFTILASLTIGSVLVSLLRTGQGRILLLRMVQAKSGRVVTGAEAGGVLRDRKS